ncbi:MAG: ribosome maturation factor RimM [Alphaproteobacteria bacterium]
MADTDSRSVRDAAQAYVCVGQIATAHGVRGLVKLRSFTADPAAIADYGPFCDEAGQRPLALRLVGRANDHFLAAVDGVADRDGALALRGRRLCVPRSRLPEPEEEDEFYLVDLVGLAVASADGTAFGTIVGVEDHGAGDVVEIARPGMPSVTLPFTRACFPLVDVAGGRVVIAPPAGLDDAPVDAAARGRAHG